MALLESILWVLFVAACLLVSTIILLQEGKGGGLGEAFGGAGQQTFGVKAEGINKFTAWVSVAVIVIAIVITQIRGLQSGLTFSDPLPAAPAGETGTTGGAAPTDGAGQ